MDMVPDSAVDRLHFGTNPDPQIHTADLLIRIRILFRILLFSLVAFRMPTKKIFFQICFASYILKVHLHHSLKIKSPKEVIKQWKSGFFLQFLRDDPRIRIHTNNDGSGSRRFKNIRVGLDPDPQHWFRVQEN
jgi:hypothetical protein